MCVYVCVCSTYHIPGSLVDRPSNSAALALLFNRMLNISARACEICHKHADRERALSGQPPIKDTFLNRTLKWCPDYRYSTCIHVYGSEPTMCVSKTL